jgi:hypothetical protein
MVGPDDATQAVGLGSDRGEPPLEETLLGDPADLHATEAVGAAKGAASAKASAQANGSAQAGPNAKTQQTTRLGAEAAASPEAAARAQRGPAWMRQTTGAVKHGADVGADVADAVYGRIQRITGAEGAGESGLSHVIELNAVVATGDLLITVALASSLFFSLQPDEARSKVALYLAVTMVPFVVLAPVIGPLLDRLRGGRRFAMATTALIRALLALVLAKTIASGSLAVYPAAFGCLAASRAYGVSRSAVIPRVLPSGTSLVSSRRWPRRRSATASASSTARCRCCWPRWSSSRAPRSRCGCRSTWTRTRASSRPSCAARTTASTRTRPGSRAPCRTSGCARSARTC